MKIDLSNVIQMEYLIGLFLLLLIELLYFKIANKFNIIDRPNERSSHSSITLRGGGIVFYFSVLFYFIWSGFQYPWFFLGLSMMTLVSFIDDIVTLSNRVRLLVHFLSVLLMAFELQAFGLPWYLLLLSFVIAVGVINAYNFMDGINGITVVYSLAITSLLLIVNEKIGFINNEFLILVALGLLVFAFFNFRIKAKCFAGDVGSVSIAYILLFAIGLLILRTDNIIYILFLSVYGIDAIWTIILRLRRKENIFKAHRTHLYQYLANEAGGNKLVISLLYGLVQFLIGLLVIVVADYSLGFRLLFSVALLFVLSVSYLLYKAYVIKRYVEQTNDSNLC